LVLKNPGSPGFFRFWRLAGFRGDFLPSEPRSSTRMVACSGYFRVVRLEAWAGSIDILSAMKGRLSA
jgi:hypothetical protein